MTRLTLTLTLALLTLTISAVSADYCEDFETGTAGSFWSGNPLDQAGHWQIRLASDVRLEVPDLPAEPSGSYIAHISPLESNTYHAYIHGRLVTIKASQYPAGSTISFRYWVRSQYEASAALDLRFVIGTAEQPTPFLDLSSESGPDNDQWKMVTAEIPATNISVKISIFGGRGLHPLDQVAIDDITVHGPSGLDHPCGEPLVSTTVAPTTAAPTTTTTEPTTTTPAPTTTTPTTTPAPTTTTPAPTTTTPTTTPAPTTTTPAPTTTTPAPTTTTPTTTPVPTTTTPTTTPSPTTTPAPTTTTPAPTTTTPAPTTTTHAPTTTPAPAPTTQDPDLGCVCSLGLHDYHLADSVHTLVTFPPLPSNGCSHDAERPCDEECRTTVDVLEAEGSWTVKMDGVRIGDIACAALGQDESHGLLTDMFHKVCEREMKHSGNFEPHLCCRNGVYEECRWGMARNRLVRSRP